MKLKIEIVIARYNEDLSWLKKIPKSIKITIYNKGLDDIEKIDGVKYDIIKLPNIGRESHTYLYHIINNYDNLAHKTIFCQGDSIFHSPGFLDLLKNVKLFEHVQPLSAYYCDDSNTLHPFYAPPKPLLDETKNLWIKGNPIYVEYIDNNFITRYPYTFNDEIFMKLVKLIKKYYNTDNVFKFFIERLRLKNVDLDDLFPICYAGLFSLNKEVILENSVDYYNNIMSMLLYDIRIDKRYNNKKLLDFGLFLERLWLVIFNYKKHNKNYINMKIKDFPLYTYNLSIKSNKFKSIVNFKIFNIVSELFINITIDDFLYYINITKYLIYFKYSKKIKFYKNNIFDKKFQNIFQYMTNIEIKIELYNNTLNILINNFNILSYKPKYNINKINDIKILSITNDNKLIDLLNPKIIDRKELNYNDIFKCLLSDLNPFWLN